MSLALRSALFAVIVPGVAAVLVPSWILSRGDGTAGPADWYAVPVIVFGAVLFLTCVWVFTVVGRGTPGPWDAPRHFVAVGPYRWVRNPMYVAAVLIVTGEAWLFRSLALLVYAGAMAVSFHLFAVGYEERKLRRAFGETYTEYTRAVRRWIPRPPHRN